MQLTYLLLTIGLTGIAAISLAVILSCLGGTIGIILGTLGTLAINRFFPAAITLSSVATAFLVSSLVGIIFGVAPARKASKLSPIEALRYE